MKKFYLYILASKKDGVLYTGITNSLSRRMHEHSSHAGCAFTRKYNVSILVYYEIHDTFDTAVVREKQIKTRQRAWKIRLIEEHNPEWKDLSIGVMLD